MAGEMMSNHFQVQHVSHPILDNCDPKKFAIGKNADVFGFRTKYLSLIKDMEGRLLNLT